MAGLFGWSLVNSRFLIVLSRRRHFQHISYLASIYISHDPGHSGPFILLFYITKIITLLRKHLNVFTYWKFSRDMVLLSKIYWPFILPL